MISGGRILWNAIAICGMAKTTWQTGNLKMNGDFGESFWDMISGESQGDREEIQPEESEDDAGAQKDFWSIQGDFVYRHHIEPRVQLHVPKEESFPIPLKYIDVSRTTRTNLDVKQ